MDEPKPFLKWAGGKRQLLSELSKYIPAEFNKYIEPMIGGGAFFFHIKPDRAILADKNKDLILTYQVVRDNVEDLITSLQAYKNEEEFYYSVRAQDTSELNQLERASRMIYLNKTCFNGLYRVNKKGEFNVPFGHRNNPTIVNETNLRAVSKLLTGTKLIHGDYADILQSSAEPGDFVYLDPPYYPAGGYAEFKRYTKDFFYKTDHKKLRNEFVRLVENNIWVLLTNSDTNPVRELYEGFDVEIVNTRRSISSKASSRGKGFDIIVSATSPPRKTNNNLAREENIIENFPGTRFMGSKYSVLPSIKECIRNLDFNTVLDAFSGSGCVSYLFKQLGKEVYSNDHMHFAYHIAKSTVENNKIQLEGEDIAMLMTRNMNSKSFISDTFDGLYFSEEENIFLDSLQANIERLDSEYKKSLAYSAISRACLKRRPRGIFTFVGDRYNDGRKDLKISLQDHFRENIDLFNNAVFDNDQDNIAFNKDVFSLDIKADLVYLDPPYYSQKSDNDYIRRYHFIEGFARNWEGVDIQYETKTNKFKRYDTPFGYKNRIYDAFEDMIEKFHKSILVISYSSNSLPKKWEIVDMLKKYKQHVKVSLVEHQYSFGTHSHKKNNKTNQVSEYIFVAY